MLKIATWNVNSLRTRLEHVLKWLQKERPHILALQEIKLLDQFPHEALGAEGYTAVYVGQKAYNGVAVLSRSPFEEAEQVVELPGDPSDEAKRLLAVTVGGIRVVNVYVPNGAVLGDPKFDYKLKWLSRLQAWLKMELQRFPKLVLLGDFNIAPDNLDVHDPDKWQDSVLVRPEVRQVFQNLIQLGLTDPLRLFQPDEKIFSWWDYRLAAFQRNWGLRIDHVLVSDALKASCVDGYVDLQPRGWVKPSDHAPVVVNFSSELLLSQ